MPLDPLDHERLESLVTERDAAANEASCRDAYLQGRIDEYCGQNAIDQSDTTLDLKLGELEDM